MGAHSNISQGGSAAIPETEIWEYRECFNWFDKDGDGYISSVELPVAVRAVGQYWSFEDLKRLTAEFKQNQKISFQQYLTICSRRYGLRPNLKELENAFDALDRHHTGKIYLEDLRHVVNVTGEKLTREEFNELCAATGGINYNDASQTIDKKQFVQLFGGPFLTPDPEE